MQCGERDAAVRLGGVDERWVLQVPLEAADRQHRGGGFDRDVTAHALDWSMYALPTPRV